MSNGTRSWRGDVLRVASALLLASAVGATTAAPLLDVSRTSIDYGRSPEGVPFVQPVFLANVGDAPLTLSGFPITGKGAADFAVAGTCTAPSVLVPGARCRLDVLGSITGYPSIATLAIQSDSIGGPVAVSLYGLRSTDLYRGLTASPPWIDFDHQAVGTTSASLTLTFTDPDAVAAILDSVTLQGKNPGDFTMTTDCVVGQSYVNGTGCNVTIAFVPTADGPRAAQLVFSVHPRGFGPDYVAFSYSVTGVGGVVAPVDVVEYYNAVLDHYFITWNATEQANLDAGKTPTRWSRTGYAFHAYLTPLATTSPVCRYYLPPQFGDSHFFGRGTAECDATGLAHPEFRLEDPQFMHTILPTAGTCPAGTIPVYRVFSNRPDANHRYMTDRSIRDQMVAKGWLAEGDGPDLVVMCAP